MKEMLRAALVAIRFGKSRTGPHRTGSRSRQRGSLGSHALRFESLEDRRLLTGPYAPAADLPGSTAVDKDDASLLAWATGWEDYVVGDGVIAEFQTPEKAIGQATDDPIDIVSLGRGGEITLTFDRPITNGSGADFAVFENGVTDTFLELGYVEVSSDGTNFFRFPNDSLTPGPVTSFAPVDPTNVTGYASKYRLGYGTPFDLEELIGASPLLNVNRVTHVKVIDITGDGTFLDTNGDPIYDPYQTVHSAGVDLEAVGAMNLAPALTVTITPETVSEADAPQMAGFEDVGATLAPESVFNGADGSGDFESDGISFNNSYTDFGGGFFSWNGWSYSNQTDNTTPGYANQFSAFPGGGAGDSATYGVGFVDAFAGVLPTIELTDKPVGTDFDSLMVSNTTYAGLSMREGDGFAKKFGGDSGDEPDWFRLTIEGLIDESLSVGTVEVYLADFRFANNAEDYVLDEWTWVDLSSLAGAIKLEFSLASSDNGNFGMNTPAYFAVDNVVVSVEGEAAAMGVVHRNAGDLSGPLVVSLDNGDTSEVQVPASVTIQAGQAAASFDVFPIDDFLVDGTQTAIIEATATGYPSSSVPIEVTDSNVPTLTLTVAPEVVDETAAGLAVATGVVHRNDEDLSGSLEVTLSSDDESEVRVPATVVIPAGQASVQFDVEVRDDMDVDGTQTATVLASATGYTESSDTLDVTDDDIAPDLVGLYRNRRFLLDANASGKWNGSAGGDLNLNLSKINATPIAGDWDGDGFDEIGLYWNKKFYLDFNGDGKWNGPGGGDVVHAFASFGGRPVIGDWNGDGVDDIGLYRANTKRFYLDYNGSGKWDGGGQGEEDDRNYRFSGTAATPIAGDWDGNGSDEIGLYLNRRFYLDHNGNGKWNGVGDGKDVRYVFANFSGAPITGDWDHDGDDDIGLYRNQNRRFYLDVSDNGKWRPVAGGDRAHSFINAQGTPLIGKWAAPEQLVAAPGAAPAARQAAPHETLTRAALAPVVERAIDIWSAGPLTAEQQRAIRQLDVRIADLPGAVLGQAYGSTITLDVSAAGWGWHVEKGKGQGVKGEAERTDPQSPLLIPHSDFRIPTSMDLLTAVLHELGHVLGYGHTDNGVMDDTLSLSDSRPATTSVDAYFARL